MLIDEFGVAHRTADELCELLYLNPNLQLNEVAVDNPEQFNNSALSLFYKIVPLSKYIPPKIPLEEFDQFNQNSWFMPDDYKTLDIASWVLDKCKTEEELQRVGKELLMFQDRDLFDLLRYMKYFVDVMRNANVVWGVGRGSSVSSYVLFLIGVHKIDAIYYDLNISEFLK